MTHVYIQPPLFLAAKAIRDRKSGIQWDKCQNKLFYSLICKYLPVNGKIFRNPLAKLQLETLGELNFFFFKFTTAKFLPLPSTQRLKMSQRVVCVRSICLKRIRKCFMTDLRRQLRTRLKE